MRSSSTAEVPVHTCRDRVEDPLQPSFASTVRQELPDVFTVDDAFAAGWTMSALKHGLRTGRFVRIRKGVYRQGVPDLRAQVIAAARAFPDGVVSHRCAALLHGFPIVGRRPDLPELTVRPRANGDRAGVHVYRARLREHDLTVVDGVAVTSAARTALDVARHCSFAVAVAVLDAALHSRTTIEELADVSSFCTSWFGARSARRALAFADGRAESPLESVSRIAIARLGLRRPELQTEFLDGRLRFVGRGDFYWDDVGVIGEADGRSKYDLDDRDVRDVFAAEKDRQEALEDLRLVVVRWGWSLATGTRPDLRRKIEHGFDRGRLRDASGASRLWTPRLMPFGGSATAA